MNSLDTNLLYLFPKWPTVCAEQRLGLGHQQLQWSLSKHGTPEMMETGQSVNHHDFSNACGPALQGCELQQLVLWQIAVAATQGSTLSYLEICNMVLFKMSLGGKLRIRSACLITVLDIICLFWYWMTQLTNIFLQFLMHVNSFKGLGPGKLLVCVWVKTHDSGCCYNLTV